MDIRNLVRLPLPDQEVLTPTAAFKGSVGHVSQRTSMVGREGWSQSVMMPRHDRGGFMPVGNLVSMCATATPTDTDIVFETGPNLLYTTGLVSGIAIATLCGFDAVTGTFNQRGMVHLSTGDFGAPFLTELAAALRAAPHVLIAFGDDYERDYLTSTGWGPAFLGALSNAMQSFGKAGPASMQVVFPSVVPQGQDRGSLAVAADGHFGFLRVS